MPQSKFEKFMDNGGYCCFILGIFLLMGFLIFMSDRGFSQEAVKDHKKFQTLTIPICGAAIDASEQVYTVTVLDNQNAFKPKQEKYVRALVPKGLTNYKNTKITRLFFANTADEQRLVISVGESLSVYYDVYLLKSNPPSYY